MPRSAKDSDEDVESRTGRRTRTFSIQSMVDSPIRRSSRIKQSAKLQKFSPDSESDTSVSSNQPVRSTKRMATMDSITAETLRGRRTRKLSISSETSEIIDVETITPSKRTTRKSLTAVTSNTPTRASTRVASKRLLRAGSETKSSPPASRTTRRTRASSVDPENMTDETKNLPRILTNLRRRTSMLPLQSPVKEEIEKQQESDVKIDTTLVEEFTNPGNNYSSKMIAGSKESQKVMEIDKAKEDGVEEDNRCDRIIPARASDEAFQQLKNNEIQNKHTVATIIDKKSLNKVQYSCTENVPSDVDMSDEILIVDSNSHSNKKGDKSRSIENEESIAEIDNSLIDTCKKSPTKELTVRLENILNSASIGEQKSSSNKENQTLNIISDTSAEKNIGPIITNITSLSIKSPTTVFANKSLNEKEIQLAKNELSLSKRRRSKESTETTVKHIINDTVKSVSSMVDTVELVEEVIDNQTFVEVISKPEENIIEVTSKLDESIDIELCNKTVAWQESLCSLTANNEINLQLEESNAEKTKSLNKSMTTTKSNSDCLSKSIDVEICNKSITVKLPSTTQGDAKDGLSDSMEQTKKNVSNCVTKSISESSSVTLETINLSFSDLNATNVLIQDMQSHDVIDIFEESTQAMPPKKAESINISLETTGISTQRKSKDTSGVSTEKKSSQLASQENSENMEIDDDRSDIDIVSMFQDVSADNWKEDAVETKNTTEGDSNPLLVDNESEAECDLVLVDKQAWLAAENMKTEREKECFDYDSDDTMIMKSRSDTMQTNNNRKRLSTIDEALLININDDNEEEEEEKKQEEKEATPVATPVEKRKSSTKRKSAVGKNHNFATICIDVDSSSPVEFLNKSKKVLNRSSSQPASGSNKLGQVTEQSVKILDELDDEIRGDANRSSRSSQSCKNISLRKSTDKRRSLSKSSKDTPSRRSSQSSQNNSANKFQVDNSEEELDNVETHTEKNLKWEKRSSIKSDICNEDVDINKVGSKRKKKSGKESHKEDEDLLINVEDSDENDEIAQTKDLRCKKSDVNYSMLAHAGSNSNISSKSSNDSMKYYECARNLFEKNNITDDNNSKGDDNNDDNYDDSIHSIDSDVKREYNLDAAERVYSDDNIPYDECKISESEFSDPDDNDSDLADFIVVDNAIEEGERNKEGEKEKQNNEDDGQEREEDEAAEQKGVKDKNIGNEQEENANKNNSEQAEDENEKSARAKTNVSKNNASDKLFEVGKEKKMPTKHIVPHQSKEEEDVKAKISHTRNVEETIILDSSGSTSSVKIKRESHVNKTEQNTIKQINIFEINRKKLSKATRTSLECSTPKMNSSKQEFVSDIEIAASALEAEDEKSSSASETTQLNRRKSNKDSILKEDISFKESKCIDNKEKILHTSLPSDLLEKVGNTAPMFKTIELNKTVNVTHTETPTIRDLRKEKLNESAPEFKLRVEPSQLQKRRLSKEENDAQKKTNEKDSDEEVPKLVALFSDNIQEPSRRKQKKRKRQMEEMSNENITENISSQNTVESDVFKQKKKKKKKEKSYEFSQVLTMKDTIRKDTYQLTEKKKKKKIGITKTDENAKGDNVQQKHIRRKEEGELHTIQDEAQHNKKKNKTVIIVKHGSVENILDIENVTIAKEKAKRQKIAKNNETLLEELLKKKKKKKEKEVQKTEEKNISPPQIGVLKFKSKSNKKTESEKSQLQNIFLSKTIESKNAIFVKAQNEALENIKSATECIKFKELEKRKKKKREDTVNTIQEQDVEIPIKRKIEKHIEGQKQKTLLSSTDGLKRLSDNVVDKLSDVPTRVKRRKLLQNKEQAMPSLSTKNLKSYDSKAKNSNCISLSASGSTTQFSVINLLKTNKQPSKTVVSIMSYRQRMLNRNQREPTSTYLMYLRKQRAVSNDGFSNNAF